MCASSSGFIVTANNQVVPTDWSGPFLTADWDEGSDGYRAKRITDLILAGGVAHDVASMEAIQHDTVSYLAKDIQALVAALPPAALLTAGGAGVRARFSAWDGDMSVGASTPTLLAAVWQHLAALGTEETGGKYWGNPVFVVAALNASGPPDPACLAAGAASCSAFLASVLDDVGSAYSLGADGAETTARVPVWGRDVHLATAIHQTLDGSPLQCLADRSVPHGGDDFTVSVGSYALAGEEKAGLAAAVPFAQTHGSSFRHISDLARPDASKIINFLAETGAILSPAYDAELVAWATGEYKPMCMDAACAFAPGMLQQTLQPGS